MKIAILIPCYNEEITIRKVITDFKRELPQADIYVYDNNSSDNTAKIAYSAGAIVRKESRQGKGNVVRSMFRDIDADIYVMADGDDTYPAEYIHDLIKPIIDGEADMVIGDRLSNGTYTKENKRAFHDFGNQLVKNLINKLFKANYNDIMSGYRSFNHKFVKNMPVLTNGFEIETEMSLHAVDKKFQLKEVQIDYRDRPSGSFSKLNTYKDGIKVLKTIFQILKDYKPFMFFTFLSLIFLFLGILVGWPVITEYIDEKFIAKIPSAILAVGLVVLSTISFSCAIILDVIVKHNKINFELQLNKHSGSYIKHFFENSEVAVGSEKKKSI